MIARPLFIIDSIGCQEKLGISSHSAETNILFYFIKPVWKFFIPLICLSVSIDCGILINYAQAQEAPCDLSLPYSKDDPLGYQLRGDRCEGRYIKDVSSTTLTIASFVQRFDPFDQTSSASLRIEWDKPPQSDNIRLRVQSTKHRLYYRMDALPPVNSTIYLWPTNVLAALIHNRDDIGVIGTTQVLVAGKNREVYLPLRIGYQHSPEQQNGYELTVIPGMELQEMFVSLSQIGDNGQIQRVIKQDEALQYGYYPANRGIGMKVNGLEAPGLYSLELAARLKSGGAATTELWFYHTGRNLEKSQ